MKVIGITGGVGSGKTALLHLLEERVNCRVIYADDVANRVKEPDGLCYNEMIALLGEEVLSDDKADAVTVDDGSILRRIDRKKMAAKLFADDDLRRKVNAVLHPAVKAYVRDAIQAERALGVIDVLFIEAALLIEDGYREIVDEMWVVTASAAVRRERLKTARGYSDEKIDAILASQMTETEYAGNADFLIDNGGTLEEAFTRVTVRLAPDSNTDA